MATFVERLAELNAAEDVLEAVAQSEPALISGFETLYRASIRYAWVENGLAKDSLDELIGVGGAEGSWHWRRLPEPLRVEAKLLTARTAGGWANLTLAAQRTAVENFCNSVYQAANQGAQAIREFSVSPVSGNIVRVSGYFDLGSTWKMRQWYIRLIDANGSVAAPYSNIEFREIVEAEPVV